MCTRAMARNRPPLKAFAMLMNRGLRLQLLTFAGRMPKPREMKKITKMNTIFSVKISLESSLGSGSGSARV